MLLKGKVVAVYGGTSGIGRELTEKIVSLGGMVIFLGTNADKGKTLEKELNSNRRTRPRAAFHQCDVTDWAAQEELYSVASEKFRRSVDIVVVVAGILESSNIMNDTEQELVEGTYRTLEVNLTAAAKANRLAIQHFVKSNKPGCIINTSSIYGLCGAPLAPLYAASKHGIIGLTKSYGTLFRATGIRVNAVAPHFVDTPMVTGPSRDVAMALGMVSMRRCIEAYLQVIGDDSLNGDVIVVTSSRTIVEERYTDPIFETLDELCSERKNTLRRQIEKGLVG